MLLHVIKLHQHNSYGVVQKRHEINHYSHSPPLTHIHLWLWSRRPKGSVKTKPTPRVADFSEWRGTRNRCENAGNFPRPGPPSQTSKWTWGRYKFRELIIGVATVPGRWGKKKTKFLIASPFIFPRSAIKDLRAPTGNSAFVRPPGELLDVLTRERSRPEFRRSVGDVGSYYQLLK